MADARLSHDVNFACLGRRRDVQLSAQPTPKLLLDARRGGAKEVASVHARYTAAGRGRCGAEARPENALMVRQR